ncbi:MAG: ATP-binding protein [Chlorobi bacterium]|nr:ATP-binding protein [Chlorobiota bacterium]
MIKPNWDIFRAKFSENPQKNFEWFCYLLFCREFNQPFGVFRYKNQSAIETDPIKQGNEIIGWQAKFYDSSLTIHKNEILSTIQLAKKDYPDITKILFYTNQEWSQYKGQKPKGLVEIEEKAKELNIELDWRTPSRFFESPFVCIDNEIISKHFFTFDKSIFDLIEEQQKHTENILNQIHTHISFTSQTFQINRNDIVDKIKNTSNQATILSGVAGVGKTAIIKLYYEQIKDTIPFYVYKATEFNNLRNINDFFKDFNFDEFINAHKDDKEKIIVIDSAEKLLDIENTDPFKEILSILIKNNWKIIFTTRNNYLEDLNYQFFEIYNIAPLNIKISSLSEGDLHNLGDRYSFSIPSDEKILELIKNPFYLSEYLKFYNDKEEIDYIRFKNQLWAKIIKKSKPQREQCFLKIALERANSGNFFITPNSCSNILDELVKDGVLGYETAGYFITHDIYEEWALEKIIETEFVQKTSIQEFFNRIGESLPIRRTFRNWLSEKFLLNKDVMQFIENAINCDDINTFWKDEIFISVLLSDYSDTFFEIFKDKLLENNQALLRRLTFLLRIACKEVDNDFFKQLGLKNLNLFALQYVLTKPKGQGWENLIKFIFNNIRAIGINNINFILPVIHDWNSKIKEGEATRFASLIALQYYQWIIKDKVYFSRDANKEKLLQTILYGASEIKEELKRILDEILENKWKYHRDPYYELSKSILTKFEGIPVAKVLPDYALKLADLFWTYTPKRDEYYHRDSIGVEQYFGMEADHLEYFPPSAYQTPIYWLLQFSLKETINFILEFTNKTVECYAKSDLDKNQVEEVEVFIEKDKSIKQYISNRLWCTYRGTQVSPHVLESIHMALEKYFLEQGKCMDSKTLEDWLLYLLKNSRSASISAVAASIVLAYPEKTFNVAKILFKTREFFFYDTNRMILDQTVPCPLGTGVTGELFQKERIETRDLKHRRLTLEHLFLNYQVFRSEGKAKNRQEKLWKILDNYYSKLPDKSKETEEDKKWKLCLARMDGRKMKITTEQTNKGIAVQFNLELDPDLKEYSEKSLAKISEPMKYTSLKLWASYKMKNDEKYKEYKNYEDNPTQALKEVREIIEEINKTESYEFILLNRSIPAEVCSVLVRDYIDKLTEQEQKFCKDIILEVASSSFRSNYQYQISDGVESAISVLPILFKEFPDEHENIKTILLLTLFDPHNIGLYAEFSDFSANAIKELFKISFEDAQSLLFGYLTLKPKYEDLREKLRQENYKRNIYHLQENELIEKFLEKYRSELQTIISNTITYEKLGELRKIDLYILNKAFQLIPLKTKDETHKKIVKEVISSFIPRILLDDREQRIDYEIKRDFLRTFAYFVLNSCKDEIYDYLKPLIENFNSSETIAELFQEFIIAEDELQIYDNFWFVWNSFKDRVVELCSKGDGYSYIAEIVKSYLFAQTQWKETAKEWHSLKDSDKRFFKDISEKIGHCPSTLYALVKMLNGIGSSFIDDGVIWISNILKKNRNLANERLERDTILYIENLVKRYIYNNREKVKKTKELKTMILIILDFIIEKGSVVGYILRESIV